MVSRFGQALYAAQIVAPDGFNSLEQIDNRTITRSGRRLSPERITHHPSLPRLVKIGLNNDQTLSAEAVAETTARLQKQRAKNNFHSKIHRYLLTPDRHKSARILGYLASRARARQAPEFGAPTPCSDKAWGMIPGVNFWQNDDGLWRCSDHGAIYETYLTSHAVRYPSQVGSDLYTNSCAAAVFHFLAQRSQNTQQAERWTEALADIAHYLSHLRLHPRQRLESDHREFDFGPIFLALGAEAAAPWLGWSNYDPVNVYGLRYFNEALLAQSVSPKEKPALERRIALILRTLEKNQTRQGLLQDNFSGNAVASTDLTYHQYALAMLCLGNARLRNPRADAIISKAIDYSARQTLANGEPSYYGRGANNVYHVASLACALCYGIARLEQPHESILERVVSRLEAFQDAEGWWPTALNRVEYAQMMGWHGSNAQYGALSAFLLAESAQFLTECFTGTRTHAEKTSFVAIPTRPTQSNQHAALRHCVLRRRSVELALTSGGGHIPWSQGLHCSGYAGITALVVNRRNVWLTNDVLTLWKRQEIITADLPYQTLFDRRRLRSSSEVAQEAILEISGPKMKGAARYTVREDGFAVEIEHPFSTAEHNLPLLGKCRVERKSLTNVNIISEAGFIINILANDPVTIEKIEIPVNPQGPGTLIRVIGKNPKLEVVYQISETEIKQ
ncbi:putative Hepar_II_III_N domain-containing protein [Azospirillaceae bacterium]